MAICSLNALLDAILFSRPYWPWRDPFLKQFRYKWWGQNPQSLFCAHIYFKVQPKAIWDIQQCELVLLNWYLLSSKVFFNQKCPLCVTVTEGIWYQKGPNCERYPLDVINSLSPAELLHRMRTVHISSHITYITIDIKRDPFTVV